MSGAQYIAGADGPIGPLRVQPTNEEDLVSHELEMTADGVASMAFAGSRQDIWHRLGHEYEGTGLMTAAEAMERANMDRALTVRPLPLPDGVEWGMEPLHLVILEGKSGVNADGTIIDIPAKIVGMPGKSGAAAHESLSIADRFLFAEEAVKASHGEAVWSTAGLLRNGTQGFATMEAPPTIIDPNGAADIVRNYATVTWSFDSSMPTRLAASNVRVLCANTLRAHAGAKGGNMITIRHTADARNRLEIAAQHWALAQDEAAALKLQAERMLAVRDGKQALARVLDHIDPKPDESASKRTMTRWERERAEVNMLWHSPTMANLADDGWKAYNTVVEWMDWMSPVKLADGVTELDRRMERQFDGHWDGIKDLVAELVLADA
jgi:phage/plasmid-like protein (TIGR03299 family)